MFLFFVLVFLPYLMQLVTSEHILESFNSKIYSMKLKYRILFLKEFSDDDTWCAVKGLIENKKK